MKLSKYVKQNLVFFILAPIFMLTEVVGEVFLPKMTTIMLNHGLDPAMNGPFKFLGREYTGMELVLAMGGCMVALAFIMMIGGVCGNYFSTRAGTGFAADLRHDAFYKIQEYSFKNIDSFSAGSLVTRLTNDVTVLQNIIRMSLIMLLRAPGMMIGAMIMARSINTSLSLVIFIVMPVMIVVIVFMMRAAFPRFNVMQTKIDRINSAIRENLTNVRVVKSLVREDYEIKKFDEANTDLMDNSLRAFNLMVLVSPLMSLFMNGTTMTVVFVAGKQILVGDMPAGDLTAFITYIMQILFSLMMTSIIILNSSRALASAKRLKEVLNADVDIRDVPECDKELKVENGSIEFRDVDFSYYGTAEREVLHDITLKIGAGETVGIIGSTGSGKTSLVQLLPRLYDATKGEVLVDGRNVKDYTLENLRNSVAVVLQKNVLFSGTIEENLRWGNENVGTAELKAAAEDAQAAGFIESFPEGYATMLGQGGVNVSGGQKQRLCIARALLKKPKILILDDSTSAVDTATEAKINKALRERFANTTKLIIAQRISSVIAADKIVVLDEGRIVGLGTHDELMENCEEYKEIYYSQRDKEEKKA
jgi:ATP-binding cassette subfamily B protein